MLPVEVTSNTGSSFDCTTLPAIQDLKDLPGLFSKSMQV